MAANEFITVRPSYLMLIGGHKHARRRAKAILLPTKAGVILTRNCASLLAKLPM